MGEIPLNRSGGISIIIMDSDIVSASREILEKFIRELHGLTTYVKITNRQALHFKIIDIPYELAFSKLSASKRDSDQNSEYDRYESRLAKRDEALAIQNKVSAEQTVRSIVDKYGPISNEEILHYKKKLTLDGAPLMNYFQMQLVGYLYYKELGDPATFMSLHNSIDYIKLIICGKRMLQNAGMVILPYVISSKITRTATRKNISKKGISKYEKSALYQQICQKYTSDKVRNKVWEFIGTVASSQFEIIDFKDGSPTEYDGKNLPMIQDLVYEEMFFFIINI